MLGNTLRNTLSRSAAKTGGRGYACTCTETRDNSHACGDTWRSIRNDLKRIKLAQLLSPNGTVWQVTESPPESINILTSLQIKNPPPCCRSPKIDQVKGVMRVEN